MAAVLCVSECPADLRAIEDPLNADGHEVAFASDRLRAIEMLLGRGFDAAILFLGVSSREIWDLIPLVGRVDPRLPILTVAQEDSVETQREIRRSRVFYHLTQPVDADEMREALREALMHREARR